MTTRRTRRQKAVAPEQRPAPEQSPAPEAEERPKPGARAGRQGILADKVLKAVEAGAGATVYLDDIAKDYGLERNSVQNAIRNLMNTGTVPEIQVVVGGRAWRWNGSAGKHSGRIFEELAVTKSGDILIQDEQGNVYKATEV